MDNNDIKYNKNDTLDSIMKELLNKENEEIEPFNLSGDPFSGAIINNKPIAEQQELDLNWWTNDDKKETYEEKIKRLEHTYINEDLKTIWNDLKKIHPELDDPKKNEKYGNIAIELRPIKRKFADRKGSVENESMILFDYTDKTYKYFENWYNSNVKRKCCCVYYSVAAFYFYINKDGKMIKQERINSDNQALTFTFVADCDHISEEENIKYDNIFKELGLHFDSVRTNTEGWQKRFYLDTPCWDKEFVGKFTNLLLSKGFKVDERVVNKAQLARPKGGVNNKCFSGKFEDRTEQFKVTREITTSKRNNTIQLWEKLSSLPTVNPNIEVEMIKPEKNKTEKEIKQELYNNFEETYNCVLDKSLINAIPNAIKHMFMSTEEGYTNQFIMFIVPHLKNYMKLTKEEFILLMDRWAEINHYTEKDKYIYVWNHYSHKDEEGLPYYHGKYKGTELEKKFGPITKKDGQYKGILPQKCGFIDFNKADKSYIEARKILIKENEDKVIFNLKTFNKDIFKNISNNAIKIFVLMNFEFKDEGKKEWTQSELASHEYLGFTRKSISKYLKELQEYRFISCETAFTTKKQTYKYKLLDNYILPFSKNVSLSFHETQRVIRELSGNEIKGYLLLKSLLVMNNDKNVKFDRVTLGAMLGLKSFQDIADSLASKKFIRIESNGFCEPNVYIVY